MRIVITGASGNAGTALLRRLHDAAEVSAITAVTRRHPLVTDPPYSGVAWHHFDIAGPESLPRLVEVFTGADVVIHLAWQIQPSHDEAQMRWVNVEGSRRVAEAAAKAGVRQLIVASSVGAYSPGPKNTPVQEDWPTAGIVTSAYSQHKSAVERGLDAITAEYPELIITRVRPGLVFQAQAAGEIARYFLGPLVPARVLGRLWLPALPLPKQLMIQAVHADDLAEAYWILAQGQHAGAFNVAAEPMLTSDDLARALGARRAVAIPLAALRALAALSWRARLQPTDPGWLDLAAATPAMATDRIRSLGWRPMHSAQEALGELIRGMNNGAGTPSPLLQPARRRG